MSWIRKELKQTKYIFFFLKELIYLPIKHHFLLYFWITSIWKFIQYLISVRSILGQSLAQHCHWHDVVPWTLLSDVMIWRNSAVIGCLIQLRKRQFYDIKRTLSILIHNNILIQCGRFHVTRCFRRGFILKLILA